ncbi:glycoside hydrolase 3 protein [Tieghemiomyces parasiticus]|uniref:glucan endo-1,3-beta-D-glucosidase n=1 Tax=Tieghemiomyces parasiticus TaxID=78921 RepID=A0A9W8AIV2_9FUNG|nr:glycoside hydrolase 3 protein [Tieghemiomyces parasiticus]
MKVTQAITLLGAALLGSAVIAGASPHKKCRAKQASIADSVSVPVPTGTASVGVAPAPSSSNASSDDTTGRALAGLNYNARRADGSCPTLEDVKSDLDFLAGTVSKNFRIYSLTDCQQGELLLNAVKDTDYKILLGMWVGKDVNAVNAEIAELTRLAQTHTALFNGTVSGVVVGSEAIYRKDVDEATLVSYVNRSRDALRQVGISAPVTSAETYNVIDAGLVNAVDFVTMNAFPFWENKTIDEASGVFFTHLDHVKGLAGDKTVVVGETGWPTAGGNYGPGVPSLENFKTYLGQFVCEAKKRDLQYYWFAAFDEPWKADEHTIGVEPNWGLTTSDRRTWKIDGPFYQC